VRGQRGGAGAQVEVELTVREPLGHPVPDVHGERGLADAAHARDGRHDHRGRALQRLDHRRDLGGATGEVGEVRRKLAWQQGGWPSARPAAPPRDSRQLGALVLREAERSGEPADRVAAGVAPFAAFEGADGLAGQTRALGELLLRQRHLPPVLPQQRPERRVHRLLPPGL
jgi:hypothetical protein